MRHDNSGTSLVLRVGSPPPYRNLAEFTLALVMFATPFLGWFPAAIVVAAYWDRFVHVGFVFVFMAVLVGGTLATTAILARSRLRVGADGLVWRWFWRKEIVLYADIAAVDTGEGEVSITLRSGRRFRWPFWGYSKHPTGLPPAALELLERIQGAMAGPLDGGVDGSTAALERRGRPLAAWLAALRALGSGASADHRTAPLTADRLWQVVRDPKQSPSTRISAAVALRPGLDGRGVAGLRIAAQTTVDPKLSAALEAAAAEDEHELHEVLEALEPTRRRRI